MKGFMSLIVSLLAIVMFLIIMVLMPLVDSFSIAFIPWLDGNGRMMVYLFKIVLLSSPILFILGYHAVTYLKNQEFGGRQF